MFTQIMRAITVAVFLLWSTIPAYEAPSEVFQKRVEELVRWIVKHSSYPATLQRMPEFVFLPTPEIARLTRASLLGYKDPSDVKAAYSTGTIYLSDKFALGRDDYALVHELVHHLQYETNKKFVCSREREREAYTLQIKFSEETGIGIDQKPNDMFMLLLQCHVRLGSTTSTKTPRRSAPRHFFT